MTKIEKRLAGEMLRLAADKFSNHGCNDLDDEIIALIPDSMCDDIRAWNGADDDDWPETSGHIGDSSLMRYLSDLLLDGAGADDSLETVGQLVDKCENYMSATELPLPPHIHVQGLSAGMKELRDRMKELYFQLGGEDVWE